MKSELKLKLFSKLKEEFLLATDLDNYSALIFEFEINEESSDDDLLICSVDIVTDYNQKENNKKISFELSIDVNRKTKINVYDDEWEEWNSYEAYHITNLWKVMFMEAFFI